MSTGASPPAPSFLCVWVAFALSLCACKRGEPGPDRENELARTRCASACASLTPCADDEPAAPRQARCIEQCAASRVQATRAGCQAAQDRALECLSTASIRCDLLTSARSALEQGRGVHGCEARFEELARCSAPCREAGVVRSTSGRLTISGAEVDVGSELESLGCGPLQHALARKAPAGAPCQHVSVCTPSECRCPASNAGYAARVCVSGRCGTAEQACELAPRSVGYDACKGR